mgnify:CR=1 FL=1
MKLSGFSFFAKLLLNLYAYPLFFLLLKRYNIIILSEGRCSDVLSIWQKRNKLSQA